MAKPAEDRFTIDAYTPDTIPMRRLAEYMQDLADLFGEREHVHFARIEAGSTVLVQRIDAEWAPSPFAALPAFAWEAPAAGAAPM
jgi:hypothetical protein